MNNYIIDTNAMISFVTDRNPAQQGKIANLLDSAAHLKIRVLCPQNVLTEFVYVMDSVYRIGKAEIRDMVRDFIRYFVIANPIVDECIMADKVARKLKKNLDFRFFTVYYSEKCHHQQRKDD